MDINHRKTTIQMTYSRRQCPLVQYKTHLQNSVDMESLPVRFLRLSFSVQEGGVFGLFALDH
jgi:hypothetical protein